ncbi:hypothetical protein Tco_1411960 [Tanacetum coccineum]
MAKMKVNKEGSEKLRLLKINNDSFACNLPLGTIFDEFNRLSGMDDGLFTYEVKIPGLPSIPCDKKEGDDSDDGDLDIYEPRVCYDENDRVYAEAVIFVNKRLVRLMDVTVKQWLDLMYGDHKKVALKIKERINSKTFNNHEGRNNEEGIQEERELNDDHGIDNLNNDLVWDNASYHANDVEYEEDRCELLGNSRQEPSVCKIERFKVIMYSFGSAEKYITIKEHEHDDWPRTKEDACHDYQEIFRIMDEG